MIIGSVPTLYRFRLSYLLVPQPATRADLAHDYTQSYLFPWRSHLFPALDFSPGLAYAQKQNTTHSIRHISH